MFLLQSMTELPESTWASRLPLQHIMDTLLKIPRQHKLIHPCQERGRYANVLEWLVAAITSLKQESLQPQELATRQQHLIVACLTELIELTRKECVEKGVILEIVLQYFTSTLNAYWHLFQSHSKEVNYEFQHNALRVEQEYLSQLQRLQTDNDAMKADKEHRWRNMFMLIKDNRIHRRQNHKLLKVVREELEKGRAVAENVLAVQLENEKLRLKVQHYEGMHPEVLTFVETSLTFVELEKKIREYPLKTKRLIKKELLGIEVAQTKGLKDKIDFIVNAIEQTGEIIDDFFDEDPIWSTFQFNISTQTESNTEDRAVNTVATRTADAHSGTYAHEHAVLGLVDTVLLSVVPPKKKRENFRQNRNAMLATTHSFSKMGLLPKREDFKPREDTKPRNVSNKKADVRNFSLCESMKITILQGRIAYISSYNTEIFNGSQVITEVEDRVRVERKQDRGKKQLTESYVQTVEQTPPEETNCYTLSVRPSCRVIRKSISSNELGPGHEGFHRRSVQRFLEISQEAHFCYDPVEHIQKKKRKESTSKDVSRNISRNNSKDISKDIAKEIGRNSMLKKIGKEKLFDRRMNTEKDSKQEKDSKGKGDSKESKEVKFVTKRAWRGEKSSQRQSTASVTEADELRYSKTQVMGTEGAETKDDQFYSLYKGMNSISQEVSVLNPLELKPGKGKSKIKPFTNAQNINRSSLEASGHKRQPSAIVPPNKMQPAKLAKVNKQSALNHKRAATEVTDPSAYGTLSSEPSFKILAPSRARPLNRISEDLSKQGLVVLDKSSSNISLKGRESPAIRGLLSQNTKEIDFTKNIEKILKSIKGQEANSNCTFKNYLGSYLKCLYGKELYASFINFLSNSPDNQEIIIAFNSLANPKLPEGYQADLFRTFAATVSKCYLANECPLNLKGRQDILKYMVSQYYEEEEAGCFEVRMQKQCCYSVMGWFNSLELEVRRKVLQSELYLFLFEVCPQTEDTVPSGLVEELSFFISRDPSIHQQLIKAKFQLNSKEPLHRLCFFCLRNKWTRMLNIQQTIRQEHAKRIGGFDPQQSIESVSNHLGELSQFQYVHRCVKYWLGLQRRYGCSVSPGLLMLAELMILEVKLREQMPLSPELNFIGLAFEGLQKKHFYQEMHQRLEANRKARS